MGLPVITYQLGNQGTTLSPQANLTSVPSDPRINYSTRSFLQQVYAQTTTGNNSSQGSTITLTLTLKPNPDSSDPAVDGTDTYVVNIATAQAIGGGSSGSSPGGGSLPNDPTGLVKAAQDVMTAFQRCEPPGTTFDQPGLDDCLRKELKAAGYSDQQVNSLIERRPSSAVPLQVGGTPCSQCLGYIGITLALWLGTGDGNQTLGAGGMNTAGNLNVDPYGPNGFPVGTGRYMPIGSGISAKIQPGDIAVAGTPFNGDHIGIVYQATDDTHMVLIESNGGFDCKITNDRGPVAKDAYTFYRKQ